MAWKNQPSDFFAARISTTDREFQSVSLNNSDWFWMRSMTSPRMRPSQRQGLPLRPTRATTCQWRPSISHGMRASRPTSVMSRSPSLLGLGRGEVEELARRMRTGREDRGQGFAGVGDEGEEGMQGGREKGHAVTLSAFSAFSASPSLPFSPSAFLAFSA